MTTIRTKHGCLNNINFHAEKPFITRPKIIGEKIIDGVRFYIGEGQKKYFSDLFNKMFGAPKGTLKPKFHKGDLIGHRGY